MPVLSRWPLTTRAIVTGVDTLCIGAALAIQPPHGARNIKRVLGKYAAAVPTDRPESDK